MDSEEKALSLYSDFREKLVRKRTSCNTDLHFIHIFCLGRKNKSSGMMIVAAFVGAMISMGFVLLVSRKVGL